MDVRVETGTKKMFLRHRWDGTVETIPPQAAPFWQCYHHHRSRDQAEFCALDYLDEIDSRHIYDYEDEDEERP